MNVYTVHLKGSPGDPAALERAIFVREGFSWSAFLFGPLWLVWNRLWLALAIWLTLEAALLAWDAFAAPPFVVTSVLQLLMQMAFGFEAAQLRRGALARRRFPMVSVVHGRRLLDAERVYFLRTAKPARQNETGHEPSLSGSVRQPDMVGLFPSVGA